MRVELKKKRVLVLYYSFSSQTKNLLQSFVAGLEDGDIEVHWQQLRPLRPLQFPLGSIPATLGMMFSTFFRRRMAIEPLDIGSLAGWDLLVLAGPTWSYNPSGPVLSCIDRDGDIFHQQRVLPFISCRRYWRQHYWSIRYLLQRRQALVLPPLVFQHIGKEPWLTIGVFLKLAGKVPEAGKSWFRKFYPKYGHSRRQVEYARKLGSIYATRLCNDTLDDDFSLPPVGEVQDEL